MRSTLEIIIAVKESRPATEEELRLALLTMANIEHFVRLELEAMIEAVGKPLAKLKAQFATGTLERMFQARKKSPAEWLGPQNTPGSPEYEAFYALGKRLLAKVEAQRPEES